MKKLLFIAMMGMMSLGVFAGNITFGFLQKCVVQYRVIDEEGNTVWSQNVSGDTCEQAIKIARWAYWFTTGDKPNYEN